MMSPSVNLLLRPKTKPYLGSAKFTRTPVSRLQRRFSSPENNREDPYEKEQSGSIMYRHPKENGGKSRSRTRFSGSRDVVLKSDIAVS
jgi:hypothetical protein